MAGDADAQSLVKLHPDGATLVLAGAGTPAAVAWEEVRQLERASHGIVAPTPAMSEHPAVFAVKRRMLAASRSLLVEIERLPRPWRTIVSKNADAVKRALHDLGVEMLYLASGERRGKDLVAWLTPLGAAVARAVSDRHLHGPRLKLPSDAAVAARAWHAAAKPGPGVAEAIGRIALARLWHGESAATRIAVDRLGRARVAPSLDATLRECAMDSIPCPPWLVDAVDRLMTDASPLGTTA